MTHFTTRLPQQVELGAIRRELYSTDVIETDGGYEVRNGRWSTPLKQYDISFPVSIRSDAVYLAVRALYELTLGGLHSFEMTDWTDHAGPTVKVRFNTPLEIQGIDINHDHIEKMTLVEVRA